MDTYAAQVKISCYWKDLIKEIDANKDNTEILDKVSTIFADKLKEDDTFFTNEQFDQVSDCALYAPRTKNSKRGTKIGIAIAMKIFPDIPPDFDTNKVARVHLYIKYHRLITKLKLVFISKLKGIQQQVIDQKKLVKAAKLQARRRDFCELKKRPISNVIMNPAAMPVNVADLDDLQPFFNFVGKNESITDFIEFTKGAYYKDGRIDMCKQVVGPHWIENLVNSIKDNVYVEHFLLGNNIIGDGVKYIAKFIEENHISKIKTWYLAGNNIDENNIELLANALKHDTYAQTLWLKRNPIKTGIKYIADMLRINKNLKLIDLHNTGILDDGVSILFDSLKTNTTLRSIYLDANGITSQGANYIADYFNYMSINKLKGITNLWLDMNRLDDEGVSIISSSLINYPYIKRLVLGSNRISYIGSKNVLNNLINHPTLFLLDLGLYKSTFDMGELPNNIGNEGVDDIITFLQTNKRIKVFNIEQNNISLESLERIGQAIINSPNILKLGHKQYDSNGGIYSKTIKDIIDQNNELANYPNTRFLTHTSKVKNIDSIYRNKM